MTQANDDERVGDDTNPGRETMAECQYVEARLKEVVDIVATYPDLGLRFEAALDLVFCLERDASLAGVSYAIDTAMNLLDGVTEPFYAECFEEIGEIKPEHFAANGQQIECICLTIALIEKPATRKLLLTNLIACARHDVKFDAWIPQVRWFLRGAAGHVDWAPTRMGDVNFKVVMMPTEDTGAADTAPADAVVH